MDAGERRSASLGAEAWRSRSLRGIIKPSNDAVLHEEVGRQQPQQQEGSSLADARHGPTASVCKVQDLQAEQGWKEEHTSFHGYSEIAAALQPQTLCHRVGALSLLNTLDKGVRHLTYLDVASKCIAHRNLQHAQQQAAALLLPMHNRRRCGSV